MREKPRKGEIMYVNDLGMRSANRVNSYRGSAGSRRNTGGSTVNADTFARQLQRTLAGRDTAAEAEEASGADSKKSCCEQCDLNSRLIAQMMTQSLYMQNGLGGMGLLGYSSEGTANLAAYRSMMGLLGGSGFFC